MKVLMIEPSFIDIYSERRKLLMADRSLPKPKAMRKVKCDMELEATASKEFELDASEYGVAIYDVKGEISKDDWWCYNMEALMNDMAAQDRDPLILSHVIAMDSGGGEATNIDTVARFIRNTIRKPVLAHVNGYSASAAYYLAAGANKIYASEPTDIFGSIGGLISIDDYAKMIAAMGITRHEIYADQSTEKNQDYKLVLQGKYDAMKENLLNPYTAQFIKTVTELRDITDDGHVFAGKTYMTEAAQAIGLIDGQRTFEAVLEEAIQLGTQFFNQNKSPQMTTINMSAPAIAGKLGMSTSEFVATDGHVTLRAEDFAAIESALADVAKPAAAPAATEPTLAEQIAKVTADLTATMKAEMDAFKLSLALPPVAAARGAATDNPPAPDARQQLLDEETKLFG